MAESYLLDTNAAIAALNGDSAVLKLVDEAETVYVPSIVLGELYYGAEKSGRVEANIQHIDEFANRRLVLNCDRETARWYGRIEFALRSKGQPIRQNDTWIAAIARQHNLTLLTRDAHFNEVDGLSVQAW